MHAHFTFLLKTFQLLAILAAITVLRTVIFAVRQFIALSRFSCLWMIFAIIANNIF